jgi:hypothetical protein
MSYFKFLGARRVIQIKFRNEDPQILGTTLQNLFAQATWRRDLCTPVLYNSLLMLSFISHYIWDSYRTV